MTAVPDSMITWSGTRHKVGGWNVRGWYGAACSSRYYLEPRHQPLAQFARPYKRDCTRCFPPAEDIGRHTLTDLERARDVAVALEQQNAALTEFVRPIAGRGCLYGKSGGCNDCSSCHALRLLKDCDAVLAGDAP